MVSETKNKDRACERAALLSECSLELHSKVSRPPSIWVLPFSEKTRNCVKKKTTSELREEKRPYLFFGKELAVFKSRPRHYFKRPSLGFPVPKNTKRPGCFFFFFFFFLRYTENDNACSHSMRRDLRATFLAKLIAPPLWSWVKQLQLLLSL